MSVSRLHDPSRIRGDETTTCNRPDLAASQPSVMLFAHSETNPASWRMIFSRSVSELSSQTIRNRAPSGTFNGEPDQALLSTFLSRVCVIRLMVRLLHFYISVLGPTPLRPHFFRAQLPSFESFPHSGRASTDSVLRTVSKNSTS